MAVAEERARELLRDGDVDVLGRMPWSSNATFLVNLADGDDEMLAIYKPQRGERPLWDFPRGTLCHREVAAFEVSDALGWDIVPDTVLRDGPARHRDDATLRRARSRGALLHAARGARRRVPAHGRVRHRDQQHRSQGRSLPAGARRRPHLRHRPRRLVPHAVEAAHGHLGVRRRVDPARRVQRSAPLARRAAAAAPAASTCATRSTASSSTRCAPAPSTSSPPASSPTPTTTTTATPGP